MSDLVDRVASRVGIDRAVAEKAVGIILDFLSKEGPADKVQALFARLPGAEALVQAARSNSGGGMFASMGGIMGVGSKLMSAGLDLGQIQGVNRELMAYSSDQGAGELLREIADAIPGLSQYV